MKLSKITGLLAFCALMVSGQSAFAASCTLPSNGSSLLAEAGTMVERARRGAGGSGISRNAQLDAAAQDHACYVSRKGYNRSAPHTGAGGSTPRKRVKRAGYRSCLTAENMGLAQTSASQIVQAWMQSPGHNANITMRGVREYGIGVAMVGTQPVWVLVLAKPC